MLELNPMNLSEKNKLKTALGDRIADEKSVGNDTKFIECLLDLLNGVYVEESEFNNAANNGNWDVYCIMSDHPNKVVCRELYAMDLHLVIFKVFLEGKPMFFKTLDRVIQK